MEILKQSTHGYSAHNSRVNVVSAGALIDDACSMITISVISSRGNNAEVRQRSNGKLAVYEVKKSISIG